MTLGRCVALIPPEGGLQPVGASTSFVYGGDPYRRIADAIIGPHAEVRHVAWGPGAGPEHGVRWVDVLPGAEAVVVAPWLSLIDRAAFDGFTLSDAPDLKVLAGTFDFRLGWVDLAESGRRGVTVVDTSRTMTPTVAEFGVAVTLSLLRDIPGSTDLVRSGGWLAGPAQDVGFIFRDLADCRVGLAGYGSINRHYRRFIEPYDCEVTVFDPFVDDERAKADGVARASSLVELAGASDILVVAIPPTPSTLGVVDVGVIDALETGSLFVLLSRMAVVEQEALWRRIGAGEIRAAIDVFDPEPPPADAWFRRAPNVLPTPHIAGNVAFAHERCFREACADALRVLRGEPPLYPATERDERLYDGSLAPEAERDSAMPRSA
jgi:D-3-phosphoglycerate dehydrogenase